MSSKDLSNVIKSTGNRLDQKATGLFGSAVEDFTRGKLGLGKAGGGRALPQGLRPASTTWDATSYAAVLAGATEFRPKLKFLFKVQFFFTPEVNAAFPDLAKNNYTFMIKAVDRPKVDFEYEDEVNQYNYRTKVLKKIKHRELTVTFMDDVGNNVFDFFRSLMMIYSPITRGAVARDNDYTAVPNSRAFELGNGMSFSGFENANTGGKANDVAHRGLVNSFAGSAITLIRVKQIFIDPTLTNPADKDKAVSSNYYDFINPRLVSFDLDDLNHESSDPNLLTMQFDYDWLEMTKNSGIQSLSDGLQPTMSTVVPSLAGQETSGISPDVLLGRNTETKSTPTTERGKTNPFVGILSNAAGQATSTITKDLAERAVAGIVGDGKFAQSKVGRALSGGLTDAFKGVTGEVGGLVSAGIRDSSNGLVSSLSSTVSTATSNAASFVTSSISGRARSIGSQAMGGIRSIFSDTTAVGSERPSARVSSQPPIPRGDEGE